MANLTCNHRSRRVGRAHNRVMRALVSELPAELRRLRVDTLAHTLANGVPVDPRALTIVLSALDETCGESLLLTRATVEQLLWIGIEQFCTSAELETPAGCVEALHAAVAVADGTKLLAPESDSTPQLFRPFQEMGLV